MKAEHILMAKGRRKIRVEHGFDGEIEGFPGELPGVLTGWQAQILHELYARTMARVTRDGG